MPTTDTRITEEIIEAPSGVIFECLYYPNKICRLMHIVTLTAYQAFVRDNAIGLTRTPYASGDAAAKEYRRLFSENKKVLAYHEIPVNFGMWDRGAWHIIDKKGAH